MANTDAAMFTIAELPEYLVDKSKAYFYLFVPFKNNHLEYDLMNMFSAITCYDLFNIYIGDSKTKDFDLSNPYLHVRVPISFYNFDNLLKASRRSPLYVDDYCDSDQTCIIRFRVIKNNSWDAFINSKYSEIYTQEELANEFLKKEYSDGKFYTKHYHVLCKNKEYANHLIDSLEITDSSLIKIMMTNELDSLVKIENLIL